VSETALRALPAFPPGLVVREYTPDDRRRCLDIFRSNIPDFLSIDDIGFLKECLDDCEGFRLVVHQARSGEVIACGGLRANGGVCRFPFGMVDRTWHGQGVGTLLLLSRLCMVDDPGDWTEIHLQTTPQASGFFQRFGFEAGPPVPDGYGHGRHAVPMVRRLHRLDRDALLVSTSLALRRSKVRTPVLDELFQLHGLAA